MQSDDPTLAQGPVAPAKLTNDIWQQIADFIVNAEFAKQHFQATQVEFQRKIQEKDQFINQQLREIKQEISHCRAIMTRTGAIQWRVDTEKLATAGKNEIRAIEDAHQNIKAAIENQCEQLNRASLNTVKDVSKLVSKVRNNDIKKLSDIKSADLKQTCENNLHRIDKIVHTFHWRNLVLTLVLTLVVSAVVSLYIDDQWPWQSHAQTVKQREAGKALMNSWSQLSQNDQTTIIEYA